MATSTTHTRSRVWRHGRRWGTAALATVCALGTTLMVAPDSFALGTSRAASRTVAHAVSGDLHFVRPVAGTDPAPVRHFTAPVRTARPVAATTAPSPTTTPPSPWLHTNRAAIVTATGAAYTIRAVNWFGMETSNCAPHGLWQIKLGAALDEIKSWGFNTLRLPYANQCLDPGAQVTGVDFNQNPDLKGLTPIQVMDKVIAAAGARGLRVILDRHRPDTGSQSALWYTPQYSEQRWISDWVMLAKRYKNNPAVIGADLHNEPHDPACWGCGDPSRDWAAAATRAGNAVLAADPNWLIFVEGVQTQGNGTTTWWGGGLADVAAHPIKLTIANHVVYSPHDYPASVYAQSWFSAPNYPANLPGVWDSNWGYLVRDNIAPVWLGEFGTKLETTSDKQWLTTLVSYLGHLHISFAYWCFNPNSGDTGGLVTDDWHTPQTAKLAVLKPLLGSGTLPPLPGGGTTSPTPAPTPTPTSPAPTPTPTPTGTGPAAPGHLTAQWTLSSSWQNGYVAQIAITATGGAVNGWTISWPDPGALTVANSWGMHCSVTGGTTTCTGSDWAQSVAAGSSTTVGLQMNTTGLAPANPVLSVS